MPVIVFSSPKGGAGKTTAATILATQLAYIGASVIIIDADPNRNVADWFKLPGAPSNLSVVDDVRGESIVDVIETAASEAAFVIIDLEGTASLTVSYAVSLADFVVIPVQGSQLDAKQAARQMKLIRAQERIVNCTIPFAMLMMRTNPAITPRTERHIETRFAEMQVPVLRTKLCDREAYRALFSVGGTLEGLAGKGVSNLEVAINNARMFAAEVIGQLRGAPAPAAPVKVVA